ncbi:MAG TPA: hydroxypyruvate isomerase [Rhodospirillaceae bacterium]|nr:hydroxypyruvate isomerase [Magnetovibrio sp.]HCS72136.1 hydroxypyruvate isomerase [Rhodospirillaceae bacterium]|tara:strand:- start:2966 stop:3760 length:795 start_codon:yes stop_codon:yes gene_type:complete
MPRFNANITMLFQEVDFMDRFQAAAKAGFKGVEYLFPYDYKAADLVDALKSNGLTQVLHNLPAGDWAKGERGLASLPDRKSEFQDSVGLAIEYATALGCPQVNCLAGIPSDGVAPEQAFETFVENLEFAAPRFDDAGIKLLVEAINTRDIPGFFLNTSAQTERVLAAVGHDNLYFQYDAYHMQIMEGDLCRTVERLLERIPHIQIADNPGRHEPGTGEINYPHFFAHLDAIGYKGWVGCEYIPATTTVEGLGWLRAAEASSKAA